MSAYRWFVWKFSPVAQEGPRTAMGIFGADADGRSLRHAISTIDAGRDEIAVSTELIAGLSAWAIRKRLRPWAALTESGRAEAERSIEREGPWIELGIELEAPESAEAA